MGGITRPAANPPASQSFLPQAGKEVKSEKMPASPAIFHISRSECAGQRPVRERSARRGSKGEPCSISPNGGSEHGAPFPQRSPALAVGTRLKPARNGRWVASAALLCFQLPTGGREACNSHSEPASRLRNVGLKGSKMTHEPSRADAAYSVFAEGEIIPPRLRPRRAPP